MRRVDEPFAMSRKGKAWLTGAKADQKMLLSRGSV